MGGSIVAYLNGLNQINQLQRQRQLFAARRSENSSFLGSFAGLHTLRTGRPQGIAARTAPRCGVLSPFVASHKTGRFVKI
jgi:hypothetical protein